MNTFPITMCDNTKLVHSYVRICSTTFEQKNNDHLAR